MLLNETMEQFLTFKLSGHIIQFLTTVYVENVTKKVF